MKIKSGKDITEDSAEGGYVASYPALKGYITCGSTIEAAADAKRVWIEAALKDSYDIPVRIFFGEIP